MDYKVTDTQLTSIANAIRTKGGTSAQLEFPNDFVDAIGDISGGGTVQALSVTQNGTYTPPSGVDGYAPVTVNVSGGGGGSDIDLSYLPNSVANDVVASADYNMAGTSVVGTFSAMLGPASQSSGVVVGDNGIELSIGKVLACSIGEPNTDVTIYGVLKNYSSSSRESFFVAAVHTLSTSRSPAWYSSNGTKVQKTVYGSYNPEITGVSAKDFHVYAMSLNQSTKKVRFYFDGAFNEELAFADSGSIVTFGRAAQDDARYDDAWYFKYGGVVLGVESDATIIANMQTIAQKLGIGA